MTHTDKMLSRKEGRVGYVIFNNPERHNAVSLEMWEATARILEDFGKDDEVRVVVLTGAGDKAFVSGADISKFENERANEEAIARYNATVERANAAVYDYPKPTIAMIRGYCIGGGVGLSLCCDLRICSDNSRFAVPAAKLGLGYAYPGLKKLVDVVGTVLRQGDLLHGAPVRRRGGAHDGPRQPRRPGRRSSRAYVKKYADTIGENAPLTIATTKFVIGEVVKEESKRDLAKCAEMVKHCFESKDYMEGRRAFMEKRKPAFTGT